MLELKGKYNKDCKVFIDEVERTALDTIQDILDDEVSKDVPVRIMPDTHNGVDIVIGFTMPLTDRVNPNHIGVDIGCGVLFAEIPELHMSLSEIDEIIRNVVPMGFSHNKEPQFYSCRKTELLCEKIGLNFDDVTKQLGTLGGGNHFIEIGKGNNGKNYLLIHSGSRNFGLQVCKYHSNKAKQNGSKYLYGDDMIEYFKDMEVAQRFAFTNRLKIELSILEALDISALSPSDQTIHNYIDFNRNIIRKGAVSAEKNEMLVIPLNMRDGTLLCKGKGNADWNYSAPHGAGRILARNQAKRQLNLQDFEETMQGIYSTSVCAETLDEAPMAYKDMNVIIDSIQDTVEIIDIIKPILNIKAK